MIELKNLTYSYGKGTMFLNTAIKNINLTVKKGEFIGLIGHTGSGKSTLVQHLNGLLKPESGTVMIDGVDINNKKNKKLKYKLKTGLVFQYPEDQLFEETVYKDIAFGPKNLGLSETEINHRVTLAAKYTDLNDRLLSVSPFELSGGQKRRAAIAGVLALFPEILVLDEPTAGLDPARRAFILNALCDYREENNTTIILISHNMDDIAKYCERVIVLSKGELALDGTTAGIFAQKEKLSELGLSVPQTETLFGGLRDRKIPVESNILTLDMAKNELFRLLGKGEDNA